MARIGTRCAYAYLRNSARRPAISLVAYIVQCGVCGKVQVGEEWQDTPGLQHPTGTTCAYGYCPPCFDQILDNLQQSQEDLSRLLDSRNA